jgi:thiamine-monophosphate kinase
MDKEQFLIAQLQSGVIGDDGAVIGDMIYSMDAFCEGVHFERSWMSPVQVGRKAMLVNLSDAVAMNAEPLYALVSVSLPKTYAEPEITALVASLEKTANRYGCRIIGGDTVGGEKLHIAITLVSRSRDPLLRKGLEEGDLLLYTGRLGESKRDLESLMRGERIAEDSRFYEPELRGAFIAQSRRYLKAGMDISDGLYCDTNKLLDANGLGMEVIVEIEEDVGMSGEEYEMLIAVAEEDLPRVKTIAAKLELELTPFAKVERNERRFPCRSHHFDESDGDT